MCILIIKIYCLRALFAQRARECLGSFLEFNKKLCVQK